MNEIEVYIPQGIDDPRIVATRKAIMTYAEERIAAINADREEVSGANWKAHKLNAFDADKELLTDKEKQIAKLVADETGAAAIIIQLRASANEIGAAIKERNNAIREAKAASEPEEEMHSYIVQMDVTDDDFKKVKALLIKAGRKLRWINVDNIDKSADAAFKKLGWKEA